jgi:hypothetical protein
MFIVNTTTDSKITFQPPNCNNWGLNFRMPEILNTYLTHHSTHNIIWRQIYYMCLCDSFSAIWYCIFIGSYNFKDKELYTHIYYYIGSGNTYFLILLYWTQILIYFFYFLLNKNIIKFAPITPWNLNECLCQYTVDLNLKNKQKLYILYTIQNYFPFSFILVSR